MIAWVAMLAKCEVAAIASPGGPKVTTEYAQKISRLAAPSFFSATKRYRLLCYLVKEGLVDRDRLNRYRPTEEGRRELAKRMGATS